MNWKLFFSLLAVFFSMGASQAATITSVSPTYGVAGDTIQFSGSGFVFPPGTNVVKFGDVLSPHTFAGSSASLQAQVPASLPVGSVVKISVATSVNGTFQENNTDFTIISAGPYVASLDPVSGDAGTLVSISGAHFVGSGGTITVRFNGVVAPVTFDTSTSDNLLVYRAPAGVTTGPVTVTRTGAPTNSSAAIFYVTPAVTNFSPSFGRAGTNVVIYGRNFQGATSVLFNGLSASVFTNDSPTQITATVPAGATTGPIRVLTAATNTFPSTSNFVIRPLITGFTPIKGNVGTNVTVFGENLWGATNVQFAGVKAAAPTGVTYGQLTAVVPNGATNGYITVITTNGTFTSTDRFYLPPRITTLSSTNAVAGTIVQVSGTNFLDASAVTFNGVAANFWVTNNGIIGAEVPLGAVTGPLFVTTPYGTTNSATLFYAPPQITGFNPTHGLPGTNVTILGTNFTGTTAVSFNGTNAAFSVTNGILTAIVPTNAVSGSISVVAPAGTNVSASAFTLDYTSDLAVTVTAPASVLLGSNYTYVITIVNNGPFSAPNVVLTNLLPGEVTLKSASKTQGSLVTSGNPVTGALGTIASGAQAVVTLTVTPNDTGTIADTASVFSGLSDPNLANNSSVRNVLIYVVPVLGMQLLSPTQIQLSWSVNLPEYFLQSSGDLASSNSWSNVLTSPEFIGDQKVVTETIGPDIKFYRLKK